MADEQENLRTPEESYLDTEPTEDYNSAQYNIFIDSLFTYGNIPNETYKVFDGLNVTLRILSPIENIEIAKKIDSAPGFNSKDLLLKLEVLARSIVAVNTQCLRFSESMLKEWQDFRNTTEKPTDIEQQRFILQYRFKQLMIEEIYKKYQDLLKKQEDIFSNLKKNLITES